MIKLLVNKWHNLPVYSIPVSELLGVRSAITVRKLPMYAEYVNRFLNNNIPTIPLICFVAGDKMLRVKHGNLLYWVAKETNTKYMPCVFPNGIANTDALLLVQMEELNLNGQKYY